MNHDAKWSIRKSKDGQFYPVAVGTNGEVLVTGETHPRLQGAIDNAIAAGCPADQLPLEYEGEV